MPTTTASSNVSTLEDALTELQRSYEQESPDASDQTTVEYIQTLSEYTETIKRLLLDSGSDDPSRTLHPPEATTRTNNINTSAELYIQGQWIALINKLKNCYITLQTKIEEKAQAEQSTATAPNELQTFLTAFISLEQKINELNSALLALIAPGEPSSEPRGNLEASPDTDNRPHPATDTPEASNNTRSDTHASASRLNLLESNVNHVQMIQGADSTPVDSKKTQTTEPKANTTNIIMTLFCIFVVSAATLTVALIPAIPAWLSAHAMWLTPLIQWGPWLPAACTAIITTALCLGVCLCLHMRKNAAPIIAHDADAKATQTDFETLVQPKLNQAGSHRTTTDAPEPSIENRP